MSIIYFTMSEISKLYIQAALREACSAIAEIGSRIAINFYVQLKLAKKESIVSVVNVFCNTF